MSPPHAPETARPSQHSKTTQPSITTNTDGPKATIEDLVKHLQNEAHFPSNNSAEIKKLSVYQVKAWIRALDTGISKKQIKVKAGKVLWALQQEAGVTREEADKIRKKADKVLGWPVPKITHPWSSSSELEKQLGQNISSSTEVELESPATKAGKVRRASGARLKRSRSLSPDPKRLDCHASKKGKNGVASDVKEEEEWIDGASSETESGEEWNPDWATDEEKEEDEE